MYIYITIYLTLTNEFIMNSDSVKLTYSNTIMGIVIFINVFPCIVYTNIRVYG